MRNLADTNTAFVDTWTHQLVSAMDQAKTPEEVDLEIKELTRGTEKLLYERSSATQDGPGIVHYKVLPGMRVFDSDNKMYIIDTQGHAVPVTVSETAHPRRQKKFYHQPIPSGMHTRPEVLLRQHAEMMDSVHYDVFMDLATSGRFGKWDTTLSIHNSANNSRDSKNSRCSGGTGGTGKSSRRSL